MSLHGNYETFHTFALFMNHEAALMRGISLLFHTLLWISCKMCINMLWKILIAITLVYKIYEAHCSRIWEIPTIRNKRVIRKYMDTRPYIHSIRNDSQLKDIFQFSSLWKCHQIFMCRSLQVNGEMALKTVVLRRMISQTMSYFFQRKYKFYCFFQESTAICFHSFSLRHFFSLSTLLLPFQPRLARISLFIPISLSLTLSLTYP